MPVHLEVIPAIWIRSWKLPENMILQLLKMLHIHLELSTRENATGAIGDFGSFSFHEVKNITSCGEGGIVITNTPYG